MIVAENLSSIPKHFADDTSLFSVVRDLNISANEINDNLNKAWAHQWKMSFNTDPLKQAQEVTFSRKTNLIILILFSTAIRIIKLLSKAFGNVY